MGVQGKEGGEEGCRRDGEHSPSESGGQRAEEEERDEGCC